MIFSEKLSLIRKSKGYTQEQLAEILGVSRQAVAKWESGQSYPDISNLIQISEEFHVTVDYLVRDSVCQKSLHIYIEGKLKLWIFSLKQKRKPMQAMDQSQKAYTLAPIFWSIGKATFFTSTLIMAGKHL